MPPGFPLRVVGRTVRRVADRAGEPAARGEVDLDIKAVRLGVEVVSLRLVDPRFYHLDTCFCPLEGGPIMYFPAAFDARSNRIIERLVPRHARIAIEEEDALHFACNAVNIGTTIVMNKASRALRANLAALGYKLIETELTEFLKAGALCEAFNTPISSHLFPEVSLPLLAALPNALYLEYMPWFEPLYGRGLVLDGEGQAVVPIAPGWGASFDPAVIARHRVA